MKTTTMPHTLAEFCLKFNYELKQSDSVSNFKSQQINIFSVFWFTLKKYVPFFKKSKQYSESCQCYNKQQKKADRKSDKRWQIDSFNKTKQILIVSYLLISVSRINKASILIMRIRRFSWIYVLSKTKVLLYQTKF